MRRLTFLFSSLAVVGCSAAHAQVSPVAVTNPVVSGQLALVPSDLQPGMGFNSRVGSVAANCVEMPNSAGNTPAATVSSPSFSIELLESSEQLRRSMGLHASASFRAGIYSANAQYQSAVEEAVSSNSVVLLIKASVRVSDNSLAAPYRLSAHAERLLASADGYTEFFAHCGDSFFRSVERGAQLFLVLRLSEVTSSRRNELRASFNGGSQAFNTSAELRQAVERSARTRSLSLNVVSRGGPTLDGGTRMATTVEGALDYLERFVQGVTAANAEPITGHYMSYLNAQSRRPRTLRMGESRLASSIDIDRLASITDSTRDSLRSLADRSARMARYVDPDACRSVLANFEEVQNGARRYLTELERAFAGTGRGESANVDELEGRFSFPLIQVPSSCVPSSVCQEASFDRYGYLSRCAYWNDGITEVRERVAFASRSVSGFWPNEPVRIRATSPAFWAFTERRSWAEVHLYVDGTAGDLYNRDQTFTMPQTFDGRQPLRLTRWVNASSTGSINSHLSTVYCHSDGDGGRGTCHFQRPTIEICSINSGGCSE
jgi:hypothetical protein